MRQRELRIQLFRRFAQKGVAQVARGLFLAFSHRSRVGAHVAAAAVKGNILFLAPRADECLVARGLLAAEPVVEMRAGDVIPLPAQKMQ